MLIFLDLRCNICKSRENLLGFSPSPIMPLIEIVNPNAEVDLHFKMEGPVFERGIPVPVMVDAMSNIQGILDKAYLGLVGRKRLSKEDRSHFFLQTQKVTRGSLFADIGVVFTGIQTVLPLIGTLGPAGVWEYTKQSYEFLKLVFKAVKNEQPVSYEWNADRSVFHTNTGTQTQTFNGPVFNIGHMSVYHYQGLAQHLEPNRVCDIQLGRPSQRDIGIALSERNLFDFPSRVEDEPHRLNCEIFDFNKFDNVGKLHVFAGQGIQEGDYKFEVIGRQDESAYIEAMLRQAVFVTCLREVSENPISGDRVVRLQVINIET